MSRCWRWRSRRSPHSVTIRPHVVVATPGRRRRLDRALHRAVRPADGRAGRSARGDARSTVECPVDGHRALGRPADLRLRIRQRRCPAAPNAPSRRAPGLKSVSGYALAAQQVFTVDSGGPMARAILPGENSERDRGGSGLPGRRQSARDARSRSPPTPIARSRGWARRSRSTCCPPTLPRKILGEMGTESNYEVTQLPRQRRAARRRCPASMTDRQKMLASVTALKCRRPLPPGHDMALVWSGKIASASGKPAGTDQRFDYTVRKPFAARFECSRTNAQAGCNPVEKAYLRFTAPIAMSLAQADADHRRRRQRDPAGVRQGRAEVGDDQRHHLRRADALFDHRQGQHARRGQGRERPRADQRRALPARHPLRCGAAAGEVRRAVRHPRS